MKNIILLITLSIITLACKAQSPIIDIHDRIEIPNGAYLKDTNNVLNKYTGTWLFTNGNTSIKIVLQKKIQVFSGSIFEDILVGEYQYIENGVEKLNTLPLINTYSPSEYYEHNLTGNFDVFPDEFPKCNTCTQYEKRIILDVSDPNPNFSHLNGMKMGLRYLNDNGNEQLQINFEMKGIITLPDNSPIEPSLPFGEYLLVKQ